MKRHHQKRGKTLKVMVGHLGGEKKRKIRTVTNGRRKPPFLTLQAVPGRLRKYKK